MKATFENTNAGDQISLDGTRCEVREKDDDSVIVGPVNVGWDRVYTPEEFAAADYQHLSGA